MDPFSVLVDAAAAAETLPGQSGRTKQNLEETLKDLKDGSHKTNVSSSDGVIVADDPKSTVSDNPSNFDLDGKAHQMTPAEGSSLPQGRIRSLRAPSSGSCHRTRSGLAASSEQFARQDEEEKASEQFEKGTLQHKLLPTKKRRMQDDKKVGEDHLCLSIQKEGNICTHEAGNNEPRAVPITIEKEPARKEKEKERAKRQHAQIKLRHQQQREAAGKMRREAQLHLQLQRQQLLTPAVAAQQPLLAKMMQQQEQIKMQQLMVAQKEQGHSSEGDVALMHQQIRLQKLSVAQQRQQQQHRQLLLLQQRELLQQKSQQQAGEHQHQLQQRNQGASQQGSHLKSQYVTLKQQSLPTKAVTNKITNVRCPGSGKDVAEGDADGTQMPMSTMVLALAPARCKKTGLSPGTKQEEVQQRQKAWNALLFSRPAQGDDRGMAEWMREVLAISGGGNEGEEVCASLFAAITGRKANPNKLLAGPPLLKRIRRC